MVLSSLVGISLNHWFGSGEGVDGIKFQDGEIHFDGLLPLPVIEAISIHAKCQRCWGSHIYRYISLMFGLF
jgi:hypothetical protein